MDSTHLIDLLSTELAPVKRLRPPAVRALIWLGAVTLFLGIIIWVSGLRPDLSMQMEKTRFIAETAAILLTGIIAAFAAFRAAIPGAPSWTLLTPLPTLLLWLLFLGKGCLDDLDSGRFAWSISTHCLQQIGWTGLVSGVPMLVMLRCAAPLQRVPLAVLAGLASASLAAFAMSLYHSYDTSVIVLISHGLIISGLVVGFGVMGPALLTRRFRLQR
ncbi:hypothetical protein VZ95_06915 [Elstera litoralis]|uniref:DUF1109 domain-containing protein n=1 Tax=Elstera litoralis TaxID=552518 RepID=A0A0F3IU41_9PROT|nr:NrsF family protein [Elstera litoralis]KJV10142.1 hypothetical protein VZ95_06915 [Elstera litoralis]